MSKKVMRAKKQALRDLKKEGFNTNLMSVSHSVFEDFLGY